jgi:transposase
MERVYVGCDAASTSFHWKGKDLAGAVVIDRRFTMGERELIEAVEATSGREVWVHLEASELAGWIRTVLRGRVARVVVSNPKASAWIAKDPRKNDRLDAEKLADQLRLGLAERHEVYYSDDQDRMVFKQLVQHYDQVTGQEVRLKLKIKARLRALGILVRGERVYGPDGRREILKGVSSAAASAAIGQLYDLLDSTLKVQADALRLMRRESQKYPEVALLDTAPGVGLIGACRFVGYIQTPHRFSSKRKLWRYCRLGVAQRSSDGKPLGPQCLDRNGLGALKDMSRKAFNGAMRTREDNGFKRAFRETLGRTSNETHARLSTQRKIVSVLRAMWKEGKEYQGDKG